MNVSVTGWCKREEDGRDREKWRQSVRSAVAEPSEWRHTTKENRVWIEINKCHPYWNDISNLYQHFAFILRNTFAHLNSYAHKHVQSDAYIGRGQTNGVLLCVHLVCVYVLLVAVTVAVVVCFIHLNFNRKLENRIYIFIFKWVNLSRIKTLAISLLYDEWGREGER